MRNLLIILTLSFCEIGSAQDYILFESFTTVETPADAEVIAAKLAARLKGKFVYYKTKEFDNGLLRIVYIPEGMTEETIKAQADYEDCFVVDFKAVPATTDKAYRFEKAKAKYDTLFPLWKYYFKADAKQDSTTQRFTNTEKNILFSFIDTGDVWVIGR